MLSSNSMTRKTLNIPLAPTNDIKDAIDSVLTEKQSKVMSSIAIGANTISDSKEDLKTVAK